jgi:(2Fe-2S) ferredoxin
MAQERQVPFVCHVFVCTNDRGGERKSCADGKSPLLREALKDEVEKHGWRGHVRVSQSGCLGLCANGPNVILYPQGIWFSGVGADDIPQILAKIETIVGEPAA